MRSLLLTILTLTCFHASGQDYHKLLVEGNSWSVVNWSWGNAGTIYYFLEGDTLINDTSYTKLYSTPDSTLQSDVSYFCGLREDTLSGEVYYYYSSYGGDRLLYKFGLDIGETVSISSFACDEIEMTVSNVDTVTDLMGIERRRMLMDPIFDRYDEYWIDGVGSTLGLLTAGNIHCVADFNQDLLCFSKFGELHYMNPMYTKCHITQVSLNENMITKDQVKVSPNPVTGVSDILIEGNSQVNGFKVYDPRGILISEFNEPKLEKGGLRPGLYFLMVEPEGGERKTISFIVQ